MGTLSLDLSFSLTQRWSVLFAPSGAGKSTILRVIAGLLKPQHGRVLSRAHPGTEVEDEFLLTDTETGVFVPPHRRVVRMVAQEPALFPHMDVMRNVKYGMLLVTRDRSEADELARYIVEILELCRITHLTTKMPAELSGGERQRVALARTIATGPGRILLLDEPFSGMDFELRDGLIRDLQTWLAKKSTPVLSVTHDVGEAFQLGAEVIRIDDGKVAAQGPVTEVLAEERLRLMDQLRG
jgi:molybdate transport system ATP-binding protein